MKKEYEATGGKFIEHDKPEEIQPGVWLTGPVPRTYPEKNYPAGIEVKEGDAWVEDYLPEDQSLSSTPRAAWCYSRVAVMRASSTPWNMRAKFIRPAPVDAAIGGFHLYNAKDEQSNWTADKLKEFQIAQILGAHCTGIESVYRLRQRLGLSRHDCVVGTVGATFDLKDGINTGRIARKSNEERELQMNLNASLGRRASFSRLRSSASLLLAAGRTRSAAIGAARPTTPPPSTRPK